NCGLSERLACEPTQFKNRNISATIVVDVKRFSHQINTGEVFDTHRSSSPILQSLTFWYPQGNACPPISTSIGTFPIFTCQPSPRPNGFLSNKSLIAHFIFLPSGPNCSRKLQKSSASFSSLIPGNTILVPGIFALGSLMYSLKVASSQTIPEFLFASE